MAEFKKNLQALFSNTRARVIILFTFALMLLAVAIGVYKISRSAMHTNGETSLNVVPTGIQSLPGGLNPTIQYAKLQQQQNVEQAKRAEQTGASAIPTIIRTQSFGDGINSILGPDQGSLGFLGLNTQNNAGPSEQGAWNQSLRSHHCDKESIQLAIGQGASAANLKVACSCPELYHSGYALPSLMSVCACSELRTLGVTIHDFKAAGMTPLQIKSCHFSVCQEEEAGYSAQAMKAAGFTAAQLKAAGFTAAQLKAAGFTAAQLKAAGFTAAQLKAAGFTPAELKAAGFTAAQLKAAGFTPAQLAAAGYTPAQIQAAEQNATDEGASNTPEGESPASQSIPERLSTLEHDLTLPENSPTLSPVQQKAQMIHDQNMKALNDRLAQQKLQLAQQQYQQKIQQRTSSMLSAATKSVQEWKTVSVQKYEEGSKAQHAAGDGSDRHGPFDTSSTSDEALAKKIKPALIETGDVLFAVVDTAVNSDEPSPILATIVSGPLRGSKLIGSFNLPANADKMVITFNTLSVPGSPGSISIHAFAIDPNTARTALSSETNHHYLTRYSALFASTFLEGFGNAFQSADTTITIGGTGGTQDTTVQNGVGRSALENAVIGLATMGKAWGQVAQKDMNQPTTVQLYAGTGIGVLFTQDVDQIVDVKAIGQSVQQRPIHLDQ